MSYDRILHDTQNVYINTERLRGVSKCGGGWNVPEEYLVAAGVSGGFVGITPSGLISADFNVDRNMISPYDPIVDLFESESISGELHYGDTKAFGFTSGILNSYECSCEIGNIPTISFALTAYGNAGGGLDVGDRNAEADDTIMIARPGSVEVDVAGYASNAVQSFKIGVEIPREPRLVTGQNGPDGFVLKEPAEVTCSFTLMINDKVAAQVSDALCSPSSQDLNFTFSGSCDDEGEVVRQFFMPSARLIGTSINGEINTGLTGEFSYVTNITDLANLKKVFTGEVF